MEILLQDRFALLLVASVFGVIFGSFATALIYRLPRDINWVSKRSSCTSCKKPLGFLDLIPILSYLLSLGKCRHCGVKYGSKYLIIELIVALNFIANFYFFGASVEAVILSLLGFAIIVLTVIDFEHYIIPDEINIFIFVLGAAFSFLKGLDFISFFVNCSLYLGVALFLRWMIYVWKKREGLGLGDVKFFLASGAFLDVAMLPFYLFSAGFSGIFLAIIWRVFKKSDIFPFGPSLSLALFLCVAFPESSYYLNEFVQHYVYSK